MDSLKYDLDHVFLRILNLSNRFTYYKYLNKPVLLSFHNDCKY